MKKFLFIVLMVLALGACRNASTDPTTDDKTNYSKSNDADTPAPVESPLKQADDVANATTSKDDAATNATTTKADDSGYTTTPDDRGNRGFGKEEEWLQYNAYHYTEYGVTCFWIRQNEGQEAMSCLPDSQINRPLHPEHEGY